ncbi:sigma-54-dependent transcriptional regulator [Pelomicrobium sp. G1]|uniref:sigma-54-dependent transcriptional regulator n=1 Tax=unclassified Pelomicrobium TaxID=2815318 RepID=UPI003F75917E
MNHSNLKIRARDERILVIDDDLGVGECIQCMLRIAGYESVFVTTAAAGLERAQNEAFDLVVSDLRLPDRSGIDVIRALREASQDTPVILMTSYSSIESAIEALRTGATDYIIKPFNNDDFLYSVERALDEQRMRKENAMLKRSLKRVYSSRRIIGESEGILRVLDMIRRVAASDANVLIEGESGTGKELVAQAIHYASPRAEGPFVPINCGAIPADLLESELFGHAKGAYTGAVAAADGLIREASGGTLFLDEISELALNLQVKLLRVLQERQVRPLGSKHTYATDARFLAASNRDLKQAMEQGLFRADLYYRLNVITIHVPPLRERGRDVEILAQHFIEEHSRRLGKRITGMSPAMRDFLYSYPWPGNVRELENLIERSVILTEGSVLSLQDPPAKGAATAPGAGTAGEFLDRPLPVEEYMKEVVRRYQDTHSEMELAAMLGVGRKALWVRRRRWGLYRNGDPRREGTGRGGLKRSA